MAQRSPCGVEPVEEVLKRRTVDVRFGRSVRPRKTRREEDMSHAAKRGAVRMQRRGIESQLLYFEDENHWVLKPQNSEQWHDQVGAWVDRWTKGS